MLKDKGMKPEDKGWLWFPPQFYTKFTPQDVDPSPCDLEFPGSDEYFLCEDPQVICVII